MGQDHKPTVVPQIAYYVFKYVHTIVLDTGFCEPYRRRPPPGSAMGCDCLWLRVPSGLQQLSERCASRLVIV